MLYSTVLLPVAFRFRQPGWWVLHVVAIGTVGVIGYLIGASRQKPADRPAGAYIPEPFRFFQMGWWVVHVLAITLVFIIGYLAGTQ